jgi:CTP synthase (UTP-ammonia lyase)
VLIAVVGERNPDNPTHSATDAALIGLGAEPAWLGTLNVLGQADRLDAYGGVLIAPGSPYASMEGALAAIRHARQRGIPVLGTCGGFQHMLIEVARDVAGIDGADHAEEHPDATELVVAPLSCSLAGQVHPVRIEAGTQAGDLYAATEANEPFFCNFGLNPAYRGRLEAAGLRFSGFDLEGEPRILELPGHPFFIGTLFVPQAAVRSGGPHPVLSGFVEAARRRASPSPLGV